MRWTRSPTGSAGDRWARALDADIRGFFDAIDHGRLMRFVAHRIWDRRVLRLIKKWPRAGIIEEGKRQVPEDGMPQGARISPLLANLYWH